MESTLLAVSVTLLLALVGAVWRFSASNARLEKTTESLTQRDVEMMQRLAALDRIPVLEQRMGQLEAAVTRMTSMWPKHEARIAVLEQRMGSTADRLRAVRASRPDPEET